jgi:hypothetical protein
MRPSVWHTRLTLSFTRISPGPGSGMATCSTRSGVIELVDDGRLHCPCHDRSPVSERTSHIWRSNQPADLRARLCRNVRAANRRKEKCRIQSARDDEPERPSLTGVAQVATRNILRFSLPPRFRLFPRKRTWVHAAGLLPFSGMPEPHTVRGSGAAGSKRVASLRIHCCTQKACMRTQNLVDGYSIQI